MKFQELIHELSSIAHTIYFDSSHYLREKTSNHTQLKQLIDEIEGFLAGNEEDNVISMDEKYFLYGTLGNLYRIYGKPENAIIYLKTYRDYAIASTNHAREIASLIRLGEALKYDGKLGDAMWNFDRALVRCKETNEGTYMDFALQHKGKCLLELNKVADAIECFQEALELRKIKGDASLISSTEQALEFAQRL